MRLPDATQFSPAHFDRDARREILLRRHEQRDDRARDQVVDLCLRAGEMRSVFASRDDCGMSGDLAIAEGRVLGGRDGHAEACGQRLRRCEHSGLLVLAQVAAVRAGVARELRFVQRLRDVEHLLRAQAQLRARGFLQRGQAERQRCRAFLALRFELGDAPVPARLRGDLGGQARIDEPPIGVEARPVGAGRFPTRDEIAVRVVD